MKITLIHLLRHFDMAATQKFEDMAETIAFVLRPGKGAHIRFSKRK